MADRLISADALIRHIENQYREWGDEYDALQILGDIEDAPTAEPKHGRWEKNGEITMFGDIPVKCSQCGFKTLQDALHRMDYHYCPNCGARMDDPQTYTISAGEV